MRVKTRFMFVSALLRRGEGGRGRGPRVPLPESRRGTGRPESNDTRPSERHFDSGRPRKPISGCRAETTQFYPSLTGRRERGGLWNGVEWRGQCNTAAETERGGGSLRSSPTTRGMPVTLDFRDDDKPHGVHCCRPPDVTTRVLLLTHHPFFRLPGIFTSPGISGDHAPCRCRRVHRGRPSRMGRQRPVGRQLEPSGWMLG